MTPLRQIFAGQEAQHIPALYFYISHLLLQRGKPITKIVELGTSMGALSIYMGLWGARLGIPVHTFDQDTFPFNREHNIDDITAKPIFEKLGIRLHHINLFSPDGDAKVKELLSDGAVYLFCDNGNKPREFQTFVPFLSGGSIVSVHDWPGEIGPTDVQGLVDSRGLVPWMEEWSPTVGTMTWLVP